LQAGEAQELGSRYWRLAKCQIGEHFAQHARELEAVPRETCGKNNVLLLGMAIHEEVGSV
jgi:hypothetical protein